MCRRSGADCRRGSELVRQETRECRRLRCWSDGVQVASYSDGEETPLSSWPWPRRRTCCSNQTQTGALQNTKNVLYLPAHLAQSSTLSSSRTNSPPALVHHMTCRLAVYEKVHLLVSSLLFFYAREKVDRPSSCSLHRRRPHFSPHNTVKRGI